MAEQSLMGDLGEGDSVFRTLSSPSYELILLHTIVSSASSG